MIVEEPHLELRCFAWLHQQVRWNDLDLGYGGVRRRILDSLGHWRQRGRGSLFPDAVDRFGRNEVDAPA